MKNLSSLLLIMFIAFLLVFIISVLIFTVIAPLNNIFTFKFGEIVTGIIKITLSFGLFLIWILIIQKIISIYLERKLRDDRN